MGGRHMIRRRFGIPMVGLILVIILLPLRAPAEASQIANHVRIAHLAWEHPRMPDALRLILLRHFDAYLAGAAGPDVFTNLVGHYDELAHTPHYHRTGELIRQMLAIAYSQPEVHLRERYLAYTVGWITHYYVDIHEHRLVNGYGGYFKHESPRHKTLEHFEIAHVMTRSEHPDTLPYVAAASGLPIPFVVDALFRTFPQSLVERLVSRARRQGQGEGRYRPCCTRSTPRD
jgi:hypothetical protein